MSDETKKYEEMWKRLDLDLPAHDQLLGVLGQFYNDIYLSQDGRLKGMEYLDFVLSEVHGLRIQEIMEAKAQGRKVVGTFCVFVPEELVLAAGGVCIGLCAGAEAGYAQAETNLPRNTCALIKSFFGFRLAGLCPYTNSSDLIVGETTCDGKKKAYEIFAELAPLYVMELPQTKSPAAKELFKSEVLRFKEKMEEISGQTITAESLGQAIKLVNRKRRALQQLNRLRAADPSPISGRDALLINQVAFYDDPERFCGAVEKLCQEVEARVQAGQGVAKPGTKRLLMSGCPMAVPNWKLPYVVEGAGAVIVGEESCVGTRSTRELVDESASDLPGMIEALVERYMKIDCACFTPNNERLDNIVQLARDLKADGVVHYALQFCQPYGIEATRVKQRLQEEGIPLLRIETDYSMEDVELLKNRVEAFVEMVS
jgi:benzoyl-CoA reductase/2-hydroxyglutaryl-CoA dehydratase subunit BcrC/BadD/HgdB